MLHKGDKLFQQWYHALCLSRKTDSEESDGVNSELELISHTCKRHLGIEYDTGNVYQHNKVMQTDFIFKKCQILFRIDCILRMSKLHQKTLTDFIFFLNMRQFFYNFSTSLFTFFVIFLIVPYSINTVNHVI